MPFLMIFGVAAALVLCAYGIQVLDDRNKQHQWDEIHHALAESHGWDERSLDSQQETQLETDTDDLCEKLSVGPRGD
ncbi:MAG: hypothetical protein JO170_12565 [Verrucomicrobia bacterium]|nr:hypothetical protein [Verrucomicrobiota bacterium]